MKAERHCTSVKILVLTALSCAFLIFAITGSAYAASENKPGFPGSSPQILVISSYTLQWPSVPNQIKGLQESIGSGAQFSYYFMDTKSVSTELAEKNLAATLDEWKANGRTYSAVVLMDDAALDFAVKNRDRYFKDLPMVFEGINSPEKAEKAARDHNMTGVVESFPIKETIQLALDINPDAVRAVVISDSTSSGKGTTGQYIAAEKYFPQLKFEIIDTMTMDADGLRMKLGNYGSDTLIFYGIMSEDADGNMYSFSDAVRFVTDSTSLPVYKADELGVGNGFIGGYTISYEEMGGQAGKMVLKLLDGTAAADIGIETLTPHPIFDASRLSRYNISGRSLPDDTEYVNYHVSFVTKYWKQLAAAAAVFLLFILLLINVVMQLNRRKLEKALEEARQANLAKSHFLSRMSHEMRTPLNAVIGYSDIGLDESSDPIDAGYFSKIHSSGKYLLGIINDVLDMSRIENRRMELAYEDTVLYELYYDVNTMMMPLGRSRDISYDTTFEGEKDLVVRCDRLRLQQIAVNLISNALKFTEPGGRVSFDMDTKTEGNRLMLTIRVEDNGIGMDDKFLPDIYKPFSQGEQSAYSAGKGTGLGLAITKSIVDMMNGSIDYTTERGKGTSFTVRITLDTKGTESGNGLKTEPVKDYNGRRVLVAEDNEMNAEIVSALLQKKGFITDIACNGEETVEKFKASDTGYYDLILMDIMMPKMNGLDATVMIRQLAREDAKKVIIIAMTANAYTEDVDKSMAAGMNAHLSKPVDTERMFRVIGEFIRP